MQKKVLQLIHGFTMGGAETLVKEYCLKLNKENYDVSVLSFFKYHTPYETLLEEAGIKVIYINDIEKRLKGNKFTNTVDLIKRYLVIRKYIRKERPDIVHSHLAVNGYVAFANPQKGTKIFHTVHNEPQRLWRKTFSRQIDFYAAKKLIKKYQMRFITLHDEMRKEVNELFGVEDSVVLNNGIDFTRFEDALSKETVRIREGIPADAYVIGHVGRFNQQKNHKFLVEVFSEVCKKNEKAFLLMVGNGSLQKEVEEQLKHLGLENRYKILSNRTDIPDLMNAMDKFVFPSRYEGLGIVLIEAQKIGLECVISDKVPDAAIVSNLAKKMPLNTSAAEWAEEAAKLKIKEVKYSGIERWDMRQVVLELEEIYNS